MPLLSVTRPELTLIATEDGQRSWDLNPDRPDDGRGANLPLIERLIITDGRLSLAAGPSQRGRLRVTITAPAVTRFVVNGSCDLSIRGYDQPSIGVSVNGSGDIEADGRAQTAEVTVSGSGDVDLSPMTLEQARAAVSGSGEARLGPTQSAELTVSGSGDIVLTREPARTTTDVSGSGRVRRD